MAEGFDILLLYHFSWSNMDSWGSSYCSFALSTDVFSTHFVWDRTYTIAQNSKEISARGEALMLLLYCF